MQRIIKALEHKQDSITVEISELKEKIAWDTMQYNQEPQRASRIKQLETQPIVQNEIIEKRSHRATEKI